MFDKPEIVAWIEPNPPHGVIASFVARDAHRAKEPAIKLCPTPDAAKGWVEGEARAVGAAVEWANKE